MFKIKNNLYYNIAACTQIANCNSKEDEMEDTKLNLVLDLVNDREFQV